MNAPSVSVLISTYNRASFLPGTLASVFGQTLAPYEVILVDDGSTDDTRAVVESLISRHPDWAKRLVYVHQTNKGKSSALNTALPLAAGDWIAFNDSDDTWRSDKLERQFEALRRFPECLACFTETTLNEFNDRHPDLTQHARDSYGKIENPSDLYPVEWPGTYMQTVVVRADLMRRFGEIDVEYRLGQDVDFLFRLGLLTPFCFSNLPLVEINRDPDRPVALMTSFPPTSWTAMLEAESRLRKWLPLLDDSRETLRSIVRHQLALARSALANRYILAGNVESARRALNDGLRDCGEARLYVKWALAHTMPGVLRKLAANRAPAEFLASDESVPWAKDPAGS